MNKREVPTMNGAELIYQERNRQLREEGWTPEHDDAHTKGELALAAYAYVLPEDERPGVTDSQGNFTPSGWPWEQKWWKPTPDDRVRELVKAGALIAAEIDRLQRQAESMRVADDQDFSYVIGKSKYGVQPQ